MAMAGARGMVGILLGCRRKLPEDEGGIGCVRSGFARGEEWSVVGARLRRDDTQKKTRGGRIRANLGVGLRESLIQGRHNARHSTTNDVTRYRGKVLLNRKFVFGLVDVGAVILDNLEDLLQRKVIFQLVSSELDPNTNELKVSPASSINDWVLTGDMEADDEEHTVTFEVPNDFGEVGAIFVRNYHRNEFLLKSFTLELEGNGDSSSPIMFACDSWIYNESKYASDRVFFRNKYYLPDDTPEGLQALRERELKELRGDGTGMRKEWERIYDYDVYNDLGFPDLNPSLQRPVLGGGEFKYPRRCRTGRPKCDTDPESESPVILTARPLAYVPRDEVFNREKNNGFLAASLKGLQELVVPAMRFYLDKASKEFKSEDDMRLQYTKGLGVQMQNAFMDASRIVSSRASNTAPDSGLMDNLPDVLRSQNVTQPVQVLEIEHPLPELVQSVLDTYSTDEEFGRQSVAGLNPIVIKAVKEFPPESTLDPNQYPGIRSKLTEAYLEPYLEGLSVAEAMESNRLFTVDYTDAIMPYVNKVNALSDEGKIYAPRTIYFLSSKGNIMPVAIELTLPPSPSNPVSNQRIFFPQTPGTIQPDFLWALAKIHANAIDFAYHQLISHWLMTHAVVEPFAIATKRHLSVMHPMHALLAPVFRHTLYINSSARSILIASGSLIESNFTAGKYCLEMSAVAYDAFWRFDTAALPDDLIARGMAVPADESHPGGVKLVLEDYPYAKDGLELWDALEKWVAKCVEIGYNGSDEAVRVDRELQAWWAEIINVGHGDKKDAPWWPKADSCKSLTKIMTTIAWITGPLHAAVNFGQYTYGAWSPNRPTFTRKLIPEVGTKDYFRMLANAEKFVISMLPTPLQVTIAVSTVSILSTHSAEEEYIGQRQSDTWCSCPRLKEAFEEFGVRVRQVEHNIHRRNNDKSLVNRCGLDGKLPYTLLVPSSEPGLTCKGVPNSISI